MKNGKREYKRFARMFLNHAGVDGNLMKAMEGLHTINLLMDKDSGLRGLLVGPQFTPGEKKEVLGHIKGEYSLNSSTDKFVSFLIDQDAMGLMPDIFEAVVRLYLERTKKAKAVVKAAIVPDKAYGERLKAALKKITDRDVEIEYVQDPSVLGGVVVQVGSMMFDGSLRGQLRLLKEELIKG